MCSVNLEEHGRTFETAALVHEQCHYEQIEYILVSIEFYANISWLTSI